MVVYATRVIRRVYGYDRKLKRSLPMFLAVLLYSVPHVLHKPKEKLIFLISIKNYNLIQIIN